MDLKFKRKSKSSREKLLVKKRLAFMEPLEQPGKILKAQIHGSAQRLLKIEKITKYVKFCKCCRLPTETTGIVVPFSCCDKTNDFGLGIFLYFYFIKFMLVILGITICMAGIPSMYLSTTYSNEITAYCNAHYNSTNNSIPEIVTTDEVCVKYITAQQAASASNGSKTDFILQMSSDNLKVYYQLFNETSNEEMLDEVVSDYGFLYFLTSLTILLTNFLLIHHVYLLDEGENIQDTTPSDFTVRLEGVSVPNGHDIKETIGDVIKQIELPDCAFEIYDIIPCLKIHQLVHLAKENYTAKTRLYHLNLFKRQKDFNAKAKFDKDHQHYFLPGCCCCQKKIPKASIEKTLKDTEEQLAKVEKDIREHSTNYFGGTAYVVFNTIDQKDSFYSYFPTSFWTKTFCSIKSFFILVVCSKCNKWYSDKDKRMLQLKNSFVVHHATEAYEIMWENGGYSKTRRLLFVILSNFITLVIMGINLGIVLGLNKLQYHAIVTGWNEIKLIQYLISAVMSIFIVVSNTSIRGLLFYLSKIEKTQTLTDYYISLSSKITIYIFINTGIIPIISNFSYNNWGNNDMLLNNMFFIFITNSILPPFLFYFGPKYLSKQCARTKAKLKLKNVPIEDSIYSQRELNEIFENPPMAICYKYGFFMNVILLSLFYCSIFPLGSILGLIGVACAYFLEILYLGLYKRPEMVNSKICKFYVGNFKFALFIFNLGNYLFLSNSMFSPRWPLINVILFAVVAVIPISSIRFNLIGISEGETNSSTYEDNFLQFSIDYEKQNPLTKKEGMIKYFKKAGSHNVLRKKQLERCIENLMNENTMDSYLKTSRNLDNLLASIEMKNQLNKIAVKSKPPKGAESKERSLKREASTFDPALTTLSVESSNGSVNCVQNSTDNALSNMMMFIDNENDINWAEYNPWNIEFLFDKEEKKEEKKKDIKQDIIQEEDNFADGFSSDFSELKHEDPPILFNGSKFEVSLPVGAKLNENSNQELNEKSIMINSDSPYTHNVKTEENIKNSPLTEDQGKQSDFIECLWKNRLRKK